MNNDLTKEAVVDTKKSSTAQKKKPSESAGAAKSAQKKKTASPEVSSKKASAPKPPEKSVSSLNNRPERKTAQPSASSKKVSASKPSEKKAGSKNGISEKKSAPPEVSSKNASTPKPSGKNVSEHSGKSEKRAVSPNVKNTVRKSAPPASQTVKKTAASKDDVRHEKKNTPEKENVSESNESGNRRQNKRSFLIAVPIVASLIILTAGVVVSSAALGIIGAEKHEAFIATEQSNVDLSSPKGKFLEGITVQGVNLGGKTMSEAQELLKIEESELIPSINYTLTCHDKIVYLTEDDFNYSFDTVQILNEAFEYSEYMRNILTEDGRTTLKDSEKKDYTITMTFDENSVKEACKSVAQKVNVEMQNAHVTNINTEKEKVSDMFSFEEGVVGYSIDVDDLATQINTLRKNEEFTANIIGQMEIVEPTVDLKDLKKNLVLISEYTTYSGNTWAGNMNMTVAMQSMTGSIIKPGEVFSFNEKTGNSNLPENGYYSAGVIVNGASADGVGGGICQAATTIYNSAIRAGMTVVEREPHTWPSTYVPVGIDSAIDYGNIDMKFRNDTEHEVYLICYMDGGTLNSYIYGYRPSDFDEITVSSWFTGSSGIGFTAAASRSYYKDGKVVKTEDLPSSFYSNGGGTSYAFDEPLDNYVYKRVFTDKQIADDEKKAQEAEKNGESADSETDSSTDSEVSDSEVSSETEDDSNESLQEETNDITEDLI